MLFKGSNTYTLNSCETIEVFYNIRTDLDKLECASHITKMIQDVTYENQNTYKILQLYLNTLYVISETDMDLEFVVSVFKLRLLCLLGFTPIVKKCTDCKTEENLCYFILKDNGFKCNICSKQDTGAIQISETTKKAIEYIVMAPAKKIYSFKVSEENKKQLVMISKLYTDIKLEKEYKI